MIQITIKESVVIEAPVERVWDYTQDWSRRIEWDPAVKSAEILATDPTPIVRVEGQGGTSFTARYRLFRRPEQTSLAITEGVPRWLGGGGSWKYESDERGTVWTQTNTVTISGRLRAWLLRWPISRQLRSLTRRAMANAKANIEVLHSQ